MKTEKRTAAKDDLSLMQFFRLFPIQVKAKHPTMPHRCRSCKRYFSVRTNSIMHRSHLSYQTWAMALYLLTTSKKGISSPDLAGKLGVSQKTAFCVKLTLGLRRKPE